MSSSPRRKAEQHWTPTGEGQEFATFATEVVGADVMVTVWAGGELDPTYLTPAQARQAAAEWPAILLRLADKADKA